MARGYGEPAPGNRSPGRWRHLIAGRAWTVAAVAVAVALLVLTVVSLRGFVTPEPDARPAAESSAAKTPDPDGGAQERTTDPSLPDPASGTPTSGTTTSGDGDDDADPSGGGDNGGTGDGGGYPTGGYPGGGEPGGDRPTGSIDEADTESECTAAGGVWCCACHSIPRYYYCTRGGCAG